MKIPTSFYELHPLTNVEIEQFLEENDVFPNLFLMRDDNKPRITDEQLYVYINL